VAPRGYGGPIQMVVGLDRNGKVLGASIVSMNETPGLGTRVKDEPAFLEQFRGLMSETIDDEVRKTDAITGATKSSRGVRHGVEAAGHVFTVVLAPGGGGQ
jgi:electron transport complex protein RnfG